MEILILLLALFVLSLFLGVELITKVPPTLHTAINVGHQCGLWYYIGWCAVGRRVRYFSHIGEWSWLYRRDSRDHQCSRWLFSD